MKQRIDQSQFDALPAAHRDRLIAWLEAHDYTRPGRSEYGVGYVGALGVPSDRRQALVTIGTLLEWLAEHGLYPSLDLVLVTAGDKWRVCVCYAGHAGYAAGYGPWDANDPITALWAAVTAVLALEVGES